jgi:uncharacterized protein YciI
MTATVRFNRMSNEDSQQFLYCLRPTRLEMLTEGPTEQERLTVNEHFEYLQRLNEAGTVRFAGRTTDQGPRTLGIVVLETQDEVTAQRLMAEDPAVRDGVMTASLQPFRIALPRE